MKRLLDILAGIKKEAVQKTSSNSQLGTHLGDESPFVALKNGYRNLAEQAPDSIPFLDYLDKEVNQLLQNAIEVANPQPAEVVRRGFFHSISIEQIFMVFLQTKTVSPLMTWQVRL